MDSRAPFSDQAIRDAVKDLPDLPTNQVQAGIVANKDDQGIEVEANKAWKNGVFIQGDASWWKNAKWKVAGWIGWSGK